MRGASFAVASILVLACGGGEPVTSPPLVRPSGLVDRSRATATIAGLVFYDALPSTGVRSPLPIQPTAFSGVRVTVITSTGEAPTTTTNSDGAYTLAVPAGTFRLRYSARGYLIAESAPVSVAIGDDIKMPNVRLRTGPWALTGTVTDSRGIPVAGVTVSVSTGAFSGGSSVTDREGHYRYAGTVRVDGSVEPHFSTVMVGAGGTGIWPASSHQAPCCESPDDTFFDFTVRHVLVVTVNGPATLHVGERTTLTEVVTFDDGPVTLLVVCPSDNPAVLAQEIDPAGNQRLHALSQGTATVLCGFLGVPARMQIQVVP